MSAMEALLVSRRTVSLEPMRDKKLRADRVEKLKPEEKTMSACGTGSEMLLQVGRGAGAGPQGGG